MASLGCVSKAACSPAAGPVVSSFFAPPLRPVVQAATQRLKPFLPFLLLLFYFLLRSASADAEKACISKLKAECGAQVD